MYGKAIVADEVNKIISESLTNTFRKKSWTSLETRLLTAKRTNPLTFDAENDFEFYFDIGRAGNCTEPFRSLLANDYAITVDDKMLDNYIDDIRLSQRTQHSP